MTTLQQTVVPNVQTHVAANLGMIEGLNLTKDILLFFYKNIYHNTTHPLAPSKPYGPRFETAQAAIPERSLCPLGRRVRHATLRT